MTASSSFANSQACKSDFQSVGVRRQLLAVIRTGAVGTFDALAALANVPPAAAQVALDNMRRAACVSVHGCEFRAAGAVGRPRKLYGPYVAQPKPVDVFAFARQAWH